jgi:hypothetical protein
MRKIRAGDFRQIADDVVPCLKIRKLYIGNCAILIILDAKHAGRPIVAYTLLHGS